MPHFDPVTGIDRFQPAWSEPDPIPGYPDYAVGAEGDDRPYSRVRKGTTALGGWLALRSGRTLGPDEKFYVRRREGQPLRLGLTVTQARALVAAAKLPPPPAPETEPAAAPEPPAVADPVAEHPVRPRQGGWGIVNRDFRLRTTYEEAQADADRINAAKPRNRRNWGVVWFDFDNVPESMIPYPYPPRISL